MKPPWYRTQTAFGFAPEAEGPLKSRRRKPPPHSKGGISSRARATRNRIDPELGHVRLCHTRGCGWWPLELFSRSKLCLHGRTYECRACAAVRKGRSRPATDLEL